MTERLEINLAARDRAEWLEHVLAELEVLEQRATDLQTALVLVGIQLRARKVDVLATEVNEAHHDTTHVVGHLTSARRGLLMAWPDLERRG